MLILQANPKQPEAINLNNCLDDYLNIQYGHAEMDATRRQLERLPQDLTVVSGIRVVLPSLVYLPNRLETPPSLAVGEPADLNSEFLHSALKARVRTSKKSREFRNSPVTSALIIEDGSGRHLFLDNDSDDAPKYATEENREQFKKLYDIEDVQIGDEFGNSGLSLVGLVRVIAGARKKAALKKESEDALVDRFLLETFAALARNGKSSDVYAALVRENSNYLKKK